MCLTSWLFSRLATSTASGVSTTMTSSTPTTLTSRLVAWTSVLRLSSTIASPTAALPCASLSRPARPPPRRRGRSSRRPAAPCGCRARRGSASDHRVVDRFGRHRSNSALPGRNEAGVGWRVPSQAARAGGGDVGPETFDRRQPDRRAQHEHPGVPVVAAVGDVSSRGRQVGLLDEARDRRAAVGADVAVAGLGPVGGDAEDHDRAVGRGVDRAAPARR